MGHDARPRIRDRQPHDRRDAVRRVGIAFQANRFPIEFRVEDYHAARAELSPAALPSRASRSTPASQPPAFFEDPDGRHPRSPALRLDPTITMSRVRSIFLGRGLGGASFQRRIGIERVQDCRERRGGSCCGALRGGDRRSRRRSAGGRDLPHHRPRIPNRAVEARDEAGQGPPRYAFEHSTRYHPKPRRRWRNTTAVISRSCIAAKEHRHVFSVATTSARWVTEKGSASVTAWRTCGNYRVDCSRSASSACCRTPTGG